MKYLMICLLLFSVLGVGLSMFVLGRLEGERVSRPVMRTKLEAVWQTKVPMIRADS